MSRIEALNEKTGLKSVRLFQNEIENIATVIIDKKGNRYAVFSTLPSNTYEHAAISNIGYSLPKGFAIEKDDEDIFF